MAPRTRDWRKLCEAAAKEQDPEKLMALVMELNKALEERGRRHDDIASYESDEEATRNESARPVESFHSTFNPDSSSLTQDSSG
jgi:hypothetical protein